MQVTTVTPSGKTLPEDAVEVTGRFPSTRSVAVGAGKVTVAPLGPVASARIGPGTVRLGGVESMTVITTEFGAELVVPSLTTRVIVQLPSARGTTGLGPVAVPNGPLH